MKKSVIIAGVIVLILILAVRGFLLLDKNNNSNNVYDSSIAPDEQKDYVGESRTIMHKDFKAVIKADWQEFEVSSLAYLYLPPNTEREDKSAEYILIASTFLGENHNFTLEELLEQGIESSKGIMPDFELTENINIEEEYLSGKKIKFTGTQDGIKRNFIQVFGIKYNFLYSITYSCLIENCNYYAIYNSLAESFEPIKAEPK